MNNKKSTKIAIFHNFMDNIGGAEYVDLVLARELNADIYTTNIDRDKINKMGFNTENIFSIGRVPLNAPFRQELAYWKFRKLDLEKRFGKKYAFYIIAGDWALAGATNNKPGLWYVYSPKREIWDLYRYVRKKHVPLALRWVFDLWVKYHRYLDKKDTKEINKIVAISKNTQSRIKRYLNKEAIIINPPTETSKFKYKRPKNYWLSVNRLFGYKRVDMQIRAFKKLSDEKLIIVGSYEQSRHFKQYVDYIKKIKPKNVEILSWVDQENLINLYANCKGFITTSKDEDFGMNVVEAMASGKPVIAPNEGGYKETINKTGILIDNINEDKLAEAIKKLSKKLKNKKNQLKYKSACQKQAKTFDTKVFIKKIKQEIKNEIK